MNAWFAACRYVYNAALETVSKSYEAHKGYYGESAKGLHKSAYTLSRELTVALKCEDLQWLRDAPNGALRDQLARVDKAFKAFFRRCKNGEEKKGYPKWKGRYSNQSFSVQHCDVGENWINIPKIGRIKAKVHRTPNGEWNKYTLFTVTRNKAGQWYVSFCATLPDVQKKTTGEEIGVDMGVKSLCVTSSGDIVDPFDLKKEQKKIKRIQKRLSRKVKGSGNREKERIKLAKAHRRLANKRAHMMHVETKRLTEKAKFLAVEDLNVKGMMAKVRPKMEEGKYVKNGRSAKKGLSRKLGENAISEFINQLEYKSEREGVEFVKISRWFPSSQLCSCCGYQNKELKLSDRFWTCPECGTEHDRDINAAKNVLLEGKNREV